MLCRDARQIDQSKISKYRLFRQIGRIFNMVDRQAVIKNSDMSEEMQAHAIECAQKAMENCNIEKDIASYIKKEFDKRWSPTWHCVVGRNFGSYVTHETKNFIYFYLGQVAILLFRSG
ncbi:Dynein light chain 1,cytoplasmic [Trichinella pseudospiralis]